MSEIGKNKIDFEKILLDIQFRILNVEWINSIWRPDCIFKNAKVILKTIPFHSEKLNNFRR